MKKYLFLLAFMIIYTSTSQIVIDANEENDIFLIPCKVNGVPLEFIFDTGATNVSISITEANFLLKNGLLDETDIKETVRYQIANGEVKEGTKINLREIEIQGYVINNITAQIVYEQNAPLLLGLSALNEIGKVILENKVLKIYPKSTVFSKEKIFNNTREILNKALSFRDETTEINCLFKENFLGIHTKVTFEEPDYEYFKPTIDEYDLKSKDYIFKQTKILVQNNQVYLKRIENSGIEIIAFMCDYKLGKKETKLIYAVASKKLIELGPTLNQNEFEKILIKQ
ncbi:retropepsin-like aspartic protease family protein [Maribacter litoralis]|uniref:retropepsin-like aspartic protease family protein n=1 Tax=Maribacter litoralis TaxID=2059726 RepID=UPI003F5CE792